MKRPTRTFLFLLFVLLFIIVTPAVLTYSQGYRIDWGRKMIVPTGALFLSPRPAPVAVSLDGKVEKTSSVIFQNMFIDNLIPKSYLVQVSKPNYHTWQKNLIVSSKMVSEARNILLIPKNLPVQEIATGVRDFYISPSHKYLLVVKDTKLPKVYRFGVQNAKFQLIFEGSEKFRGFEVSNAQWNKDSTKVLLTLEKKLEKHWVLIDMKNDFVPEIFDVTDALATLKAKVDHFVFDRENTAELFFKKENMLFSINTETKKISPPLVYDVLAYTPKENTIVYILASSGHVKIWDRASNVTRQITTSPLPPLQKSSQIVFPETKELTLLFNESAYIWDEKNSVFTKIADHIKEIRPSSDEKKLLLFGTSGIFVYWLRDVRIQPFHDKGDIERILDAKDTGEDAAWLTKDNEHIIFAGKDSLFITERDGRDKRNVHEIAKKTVQRLLYEDESQSLYFLSRPILYFTPYLFAH